MWPQNFHPPTPGVDAVLDPSVESSMLSFLRSALADSRLPGGGAVLVDPSTGATVSVASVVHAELSRQLRKRGLPDGDFHPLFTPTMAAVQVPRHNKQDPPCPFI